MDVQKAFSFDALKLRKIIMSLNVRDNKIDKLFNLSFYKNKPKWKLLQDKEKEKADREAQSAELKAIEGNVYEEADRPPQLSTSQASVLLTITEADRSPQPSSSQAQLLQAKQGDFPGASVVDSALWERLYGRELANSNYTTMNANSTAVEANPSGVNAIAPNGGQSFSFQRDHTLDAGVKTPVAWFNVPVILVTKPKRSKFGQPCISSYENTYQLDTAFNDDACESEGASLENRTAYFGPNQSKPSGRSYLSPLSVLTDSHLEYHYKGYNASATPPKAEFGSAVYEAEPRLNRRLSPIKKEPEVCEGPNDSLPIILSQLRPHDSFDSDFNMFAEGLNADSHSTLTEDSSQSEYFLPFNCKGTITEDVILASSFLQELNSAKVGCGRGRGRIRCSNTINYLS